MARPSDSDRATQLKAFMDTYRGEHGGQWPSDYAISKQFGWGAGVITRIRRLLAETGITDAADSPEPDREDLQKTEILNQLNQVLRPVVDTLHEHTLGREQRTRERLNDRLRERGQTLERVSRELAQAQAVIQSQETVIEQGREKAHEYEQTISARNSDVAQLDQEIENLKQRIIEGTEARDALRATERQLLDQLETLHKSHVEQREVDRQRSETEKDQIRVTLVDAQKNLQLTKNEIVVLSDSLKDEHRLFLQEQTSKQDALRSASTARELAEANEAKLNAAQRRIIELETENSACANLQDKLEARIDAHEDALTQKNELLATKDDLIAQLKLTLSHVSARAEKREKDDQSAEKDMNAKPGQANK